MGGSVCTWFFVPGASSPPAGFRSSERGGSAAGPFVCCERACSRFACSFGSWRRVSCSIAAVFFYARYTPRLTFTIPRRTLDDVGNCGSLQRFDTAFYPLVASDLWIVVLVWIRERFASGGSLRSGEPGRLARRETQEGAETVVSQPSVVSEVSVAVPPAAGGAVFYRHFRLFCACQDPLPWERFLRYCGWGCAVCWVWGLLCP